MLIVLVMPFGFWLMKPYNTMSSLIVFQHCTSRHHNIKKMYAQLDTDLAYSNIFAYKLVDLFMNRVHINFTTERAVTNN